MRNLSIAIVGFLLVGCAEHYPYAGSLASAEHEILNAQPLEHTYLRVEARGETWVRFRVTDENGISTNGTATLRVRHGMASVSGPDRAQATIKRVLDLK